MNTSFFNLRKLAFALILFLGCAVSGFGQPTFSWVKTSVGGSNDHGRGIFSDNVGNAITVGDFVGTVDFDPGIGVLNFSSLSNSRDVFIQKLDVNGNFLWARQIGGSDDDYATDVVLDASNNIYLIGYYSGTVDFDPGAPISNITSNSNSRDIFVEKLDPFGNLVWAKSVGGPGYDVAFSIAIDKFDNVHFTGSFTGTADFDPNAGIVNHVSNGSSDVCVAKLDANGAYLWSKSIGGSSDDIGWAIAVDTSGNVYTTGVFQGMGDHDPGAGIFNSGVNGTNIFVNKLSPTGTFIFAKTILGNSSSPKTIAVDAAGNIYIGGLFGNTIDFDPGIGTYNLSGSLGGYDAFIWKLNALGNFSFAKMHGGSGNDYVNSIQLDAVGNIYHAGFFMGTSDFDPSGASYPLTSTGVNPDCYVSKLDNNGNFAWVVAFNGTGDDGINSIHLNSSGGLYSTGYFSGNLDFDPGVGTANIVGNNDFFVHKLNLPCLSPTVPTLAAGSNVICAGSSTTLSISAGTLNSATNWHWYTSTCGGTLIGTGPSINVTPIANTTYYVRAEGGCVIPGACASITITVNTTPAQPNPISGNTFPCVGTTNTYSVTTVPGATSYTWTLPVGWTGSSTSNSLSATAGSSGGTITVTATNACGNSTVRSLTVGVNTPPPSPSMLMAPSQICINSNVQFAVLPVPGATSYTWSLPVGWTGSSTTDVINVFTGSSGGLLTVTANNICGASTPPFTSNITLLTTTSQPGPINGPTAVCAGATVTYSVNPVPGASGYQWSIPSGWTGSSTTNTITVVAGSVGGVISVNTTNFCGNSLAQSLNVTITALPSQPSNIAGNDTVCANSTNTYSVPAVSGATAYTWTLPNGWTGSSTSNSLSASAGLNGGTISVTANNTCGSSTAQTQVIMVQPLPSLTGQITGDITVCEGETYTYAVSPDPNASSYTWTLPSGWAGSSVSNSVSATAGPMAGQSP